MRKKITLLFVVLLLTGCSVTYNIKIKDSKVSEEINSYDIDIDKYENELNNPRFSLFSSYNYLDDYSSFENFPKYFQKDLSSQNVYSLQHSYDFDLSNYSDSNAVRSCYEYFKVLTEGNNVTLSTSNSFNCFSISDELEKVTVNITSYYGVVQSNADKVNGKTYTWEITKENASNKPIIFVYDQSKKNITLIDYFTDNFYIVILLGILLFVVGPILLVIKRKNNKVNKI